MIELSISHDHIMRRLSYDVESQVYQTNSPQKRIYIVFLCYYASIILLEWLFIIAVF